MKKLLKVLAAIILIVFVGVCFYLFAMNIEATIGRHQNNQSADISLIEDNQNIVFLGDSITNGFMSKGGLYPDFQGYRGIITDELSDKNISTINYAVGGYKVEDVQNQIAENVNLNEVNQEILEKNPESDVADIYKTNYVDSENVQIIEAIENADAIIITIGANDLIAELLEFDENGAMKINFDNILEKLNAIGVAKRELYDEIHTYNPDVEIYDVGIYFAYPHQSDKFMRLAYPILIVAEHKLFIDDDKDHIHYVKIRDNMQASIKTYVDNPNDIHPNQQGHEIIANEVLKEMEKYN